jgi:hypothetical protein
MTSIVKPTSNVMDAIGRYLYWQEIRLAALKFASYGADESPRVPMEIN